MSLRLMTAVTLFVAVTALLFPAAEALSGVLTISGNGPELRTMEQLARAYEKGHLGSMVDIRWDTSSDPIAMVKSSEADVAVTGHSHPDLRAISIGWDGIAVVVDFTNPVKAVTRQDVAAIFTRAVTRWSQLGGPDIEIYPIDRPQNQHIRQSVEEILGIVGQTPQVAQVIRSDQRALSTVAGNVSAVTYASLKGALDAVTYGVGVNLLMIDQVEPAEETVKDGRYTLRRPVLLLTRKEANTAADAFSAFALSKEGQVIVGEMFTPFSVPNTLTPSGREGLVQNTKE